MIYKLIMNWQLQITIKFSRNLFVNKLQKIQAIQEEPPVRMGFPVEWDIYYEMRILIQQEVEFLFYGFLGEEKRGD